MDVLFVFTSVLWDTLNHDFYFVDLKNMQYLLHAFHSWFCVCILFFCCISRRQQDLQLICPGSCSISCVEECHLSLCMTLNSFKMWMIMNIVLTSCSVDIFHFREICWQYFCWVFPSTQLMYNIPYWILRALLLF